MIVINIIISELYIRLYRITSKGGSVELLQLKYFLEVAQSEHMTNSARKLHIAQPALSQSIRRLETELGVALFERRGRNIKLTPAGTYLKERIAPALAGLETLADDVRAFAAEQERIVRVGIFSASSLVVDCIAHYAAAHPETIFQVAQRSLDESCDIAVDIAMPGAAHHTNAREAADCMLFRERIGIVVPIDCPYGADGGEVPLESLSNERFVRLSPTHRFRMLCDALCEQRSFYPRVVFESDNPEAVRKLIGTGVGVGFWPERTWKSTDTTTTRFSYLAEREFERTIAITRSPRVQSGTEAASFYRFLVEHFAAIWEGAA